MKEVIFIFDLDGTITKSETLPLIANNFNIDITEITNSSIKGEIPYIENFIKRINLLKDIEIKKISNILKKVELNEVIVDFIKNNRENCVIATTNIKEWIEEIIKDLNVKLFSSKAIIKNGKIEKLEYILKKEDIVNFYKKEGKNVVFIGDGINDLEAMREADISIACGCLHNPANFLLSIADYAVFDENRLIYFLNQILNENDDITLIMPVAGIGSRLGLSTTKSLIEINNKPLIYWHLKNLEFVKDFRLIVGYESLKVIQEVLKYRKDILFVFNHDYFYTKTGYSFYLGSKYANDYVIEWDGDLVVSKKDIKKLIQKKEYVAGSKILSKSPVFLKVKNKKVIDFSYENGEYEWSGPVCLKKDKINNNKGNVFEIIEPYLPIKFIFIDGMDIDFYEDYQKAKKKYKDYFNE
jgi:HAD superfamily phosphoserine phosphatase-like hydrolase